MTTLTDDMQKLATLADLLPVKVPELTPLEWLSLLPVVVAQLEPAQHEEFTTKLLRMLDNSGVELAGCLADEFEAARWWR